MYQVLDSVHWDGLPCSMEQLPQSLQTTWLASLYLPEEDFPYIFFGIRVWALCRLLRESARGISLPCSLYGKEHCLAGRQMLHPRHKAKNLKAACGSSAPSRIGPAAWCPHTGRVGRPLAQTISEPPLCFTVGTMHCGLYLSSWCPHTGRVGRPLAQTISEPPLCFTVGTMHCGLYLSSTLIRTIACFAPQKS